METESSEVSQFNTLCSSPSKHFVGRTKANECKERPLFLHKNALTTCLYSKNYTTVILLYLILHILWLPLESDSADEFEEIWGGETLPLASSQHSKRRPWHAANLSESAPHRLQPGPGPKREGPGLAKTFKICSKLDWQDMTRSYKIQILLCSNLLCSTSRSLNVSTCLNLQLVARTPSAHDLKQPLRVAALLVLASLQLPANAIRNHNTLVQRYEGPTPSHTLA
jgi:hypothetical protein